MAVLLQGVDYFSKSPKVFVVVVVVLQGGGEGAGQGRILVVVGLEASRESQGTLNFPIPKVFWKNKLWAFIPCFFLKISLPRKAFYTLMMFSWGASFERQFGNHLNKGIAGSQSLLQHPGPLQVISRQRL